MRPAVYDAGWLVIMTKLNRLYARTGALPAIVAALALSSTQAPAQQAQPVPTEPAPVTTVPPAVAPDEPAPATDSTAAAPASDTSTSATTTVAKPSVKRTT